MAEEIFGSSGNVTEEGSPVHMSMPNVDVGNVSLRENFLRMKKEEAIEPDIGKRQCMFFPVPRPLLDFSEVFYIPDFVSIGPRHYGKPNLRLESHKLVAMRRMEIRIQQNFRERTLESIVEKEIMVMEKCIRDYYQEELPYNPKQLAWMLTGDACFIYEFILSYCRKVQFMDDVEDLWMTTKYNSIFDSCGMNPVWKKILFNLLLFENQIPFSILELLVEMALGSVEILEKKLYNEWLASLISTRSVGVFSWPVSPPSAKGQNPHLLGAFYHAIVGPTDIYRNDSYGLDSYRRDSYRRESKPILMNRLNCYLEGPLRLLESLFPDKDTVDFLVPKLPSATELKQRGVKFRCIDPKVDFSPIQCIGFDEKSATLWLPQVHIDFLRIALIRNFIALEVTNDMYDPYPMTSFAVLMNELVDNEEDCRLLSEAGIIVNMLGSDEEVAKVLNSMVHGMEMRSSTCESIDNVRAGLRKHLRRRPRILWKILYSIYLSKPWLVILVTAATLLVIMTALQVFCLFSTCNSSPSS